MWPVVRWLAMYPMALIGSGIGGVVALFMWHYGASIFFADSPISWLDNAGFLSHGIQTAIIGTACGLGYMIAGLYTAPSRPELATQWLIGLLLVMIGMTILSCAIEGDYWAAWSSIWTLFAAFAVTQEPSIWIRNERARP